MITYVATFHTHLSALMTSRAMEQAGIVARMAPVPRKLSSSCGTCVIYEAADECRGCLDEDAERVWETIGADQYRLVLDLEE